MELISREKAISLGLKRYFTGKPCKRGHFSERNTSCKNCCECDQERYKANPEKAFEQLKNWRINNPEKNRDINRTWRKENSERLKSQIKSRYHSNPERLREKSRAWQQANPEKGKAWAQAHPEKRRSITRNYRARKRKAEGFHTAEDEINIRNKQNDRCAYCRTKLDGGGHLDHIQPISPRFTGKIGSNWPSNLQWLCESCNRSKNDRDPIEFMQSEGFLI
jgi:5-methylcytosine-specific restriction endonuclease McrA